MVQQQQQQQQPPPRQVGGGLGPLSLVPVVGHEHKMLRNASMPAKLSLAAYSVASPTTSVKRVSTPVLVIRNVDEIRVDLDAVFNVVCGFGHVVNMQRPTESSDQVRVQFGLTEQAQVALKHLDGLPLFGRPLSVEPGPEGVEDLSVVAEQGDVACYTSSPLNPFGAETKSAVLEKRIRPPSEALLVSHLPKTGVTEELLAQHFEKVGGTVTQVHMKSKRRALVSFSTLSFATNALALLNDVVFHNRHLRLSFAPS